MATVLAAAKKQGQSPRVRVGAVDFSTAEEVLKAAALLIVPEDQSQRQAFEKLMPQLYVLRNKGCSIQQLTGLLTECGFKLQPSTVRDYFREALARQMNVCQERMNEQLILMAEVRKETAGAEFSEIAGRVSATMKQRKSQAASKVDALFGTGADAGAGAVLPQNKNEGLRPSSTNTAAAEAPLVAPVANVATTEVEAESEFGLLNLRAEKQGASDKKGVSSGAASDAEKKTATSPPHSELSESPGSMPENSSPPQLRCLPLIDGLKPVKRIAGVPDFVYEPGELEHPAINGLLLSMAQRLSPLHLEYTNDLDGEIIVETPTEKRFRLLWRVPVPMTKSKTDDSFTNMDMSLFKKK
jgi:hypothetical protein